MNRIMNHIDATRVGKVGCEPSDAFRLIVWKRSSQQPLGTPSDKQPPTKLVISQNSCRLNADGPSGRHEARGERHDDQRPVTVMNVSASAALTPNRRLDISCVRPGAAKDADEHASQNDTHAVASSPAAARRRSCR